MDGAINIHATCIRLGRAGAAFGAPADAGVLLLGESGSGKSDLALRLIAMGARLVADDRTELFLEGGRLFARAPANIAGLIEVRGLGIVELSPAAKARIALAVSLASKVARLPAQRRYEPPLTLAAAQRPPLIAVLPFESSAPAKIALAVAAFERNLFRRTSHKK